MKKEWVNKENPSTDGWYDDEFIFMVGPIKYGEVSYRDKDCRTNQHPQEWMATAFHLEKGALFFSKREAEKWVEDNCKLFFEGHE